MYLVVYDTIVPTIAYSYRMSYGIRYSQGHVILVIVTYNIQRHT